MSESSGRVEQSIKNNLMVWVDEVKKYLDEHGMQVPLANLDRMMSGVRAEQMRLWGQSGDALHTFNKLEELVTRIGKVKADRVARRSIPQNPVIPTSPEQAAQMEKDINLRIKRLGEIEVHLATMTAKEFGSRFGDFIRTSITTYPKTELADKGLDLLWKLQDLYDAQNPKEKAKKPSAKIETSSIVFASSLHPEYTADKAVAKTIAGGESGLIVALDGVGSGGELSAKAAEIVQLELTHAALGLTKVPDVSQAINLLKNVVMGSSLKIKDLQRQTGDDQVDTTLSLGMVCTGPDGKRYMVTANVGDSRVYRLRPSTSEVHQLTSDHTVVERLKANGQITADEAFLHPDRNQIYRSVGDLTSVDQIDFTVTEVIDGDVFLAVSDGVSDNLTPSGFPLAVRNEFMAACAGRENPNLDQFVQEVAQRAKNIQDYTSAPQSKQDDICVSVLRVPRGYGAKPHPAPQPSPVYEPARAPGVDAIVGRTAAPVAVEQPASIIQPANRDQFSQLESGVNSPEFSRYVAHIKQATELMKQGKYGAVIELMHQRNIAEKLGLSVSESRSAFLRLDEVQNQRDVDKHASFVARNSWFLYDQKQIVLSGCLIDGQNISSYPATPGTAIHGLQQEIALVCVEEWLHGLQHLLQKSLTGVDDKELDVAQFMQRAGMQMSEAFLRRYDRGYFLSKSHGEDDSGLKQHELRNGVFVTVLRTSGTQDENWQIVGRNHQTGNLIVRSCDGLAEKELSREQISDQNKMLPTPFDNITDFTALYAKIRELKGVYGFDQYFPADKLIIILNKVRRQELTADTLPRSGGLRLKVQELLVQLGQDVLSVPVQ
ncbi:protein phosphatase 2C domain-containing protein [Candidatus Woesebacteria bacterium]|nr:protein phosphatase 2C domain-containing protein [Candidatus Woesebacteria bacterium]